MKDIDRAIEKLKAEHERAEKIEFVEDPLCYALYHTWRYYDSMRKKRKEKANEQTNI